MSRTGTALILAAAVVIGSGCSDDSGETDLTVPPEESPENPDVAWPGDGGRTGNVDLGQGLVAELPVSWEVEPFEAPARDDPCTGPAAVLRPGEQGPSLQLALHPAGCGSDERIINGFHGTYTFLDEVPDPQEVEEHEVAAGSLTTFTQRYEEYTNEQNVYEDHVGLLELDAPPDAEHPSVMILDAKGEFTLSDLVAVAEAIDTAS